MGYLKAQRRIAVVVFNKRNRSLFRVHRRRVHKNMKLL